MDQAVTHCNVAHWAYGTLVLAMPTERNGEYGIVAKALAKVSLFITWKLMLEPNFFSEEKVCLLVWNWGFLCSWKTNVSAWQFGSLFFQPKTKVLWSSLLPYLKQTFPKHVFRQTNKLFEKKVCFRAFQTSSDGVCFEFPVSTNVSEKVSFEPWNLHFHKGNISFYRKTFVFFFHCSHSQAWTAPKHSFPAEKQTFSAL